MFTMSGRRELTREIEELKGQIAALTQQGQGGSRQGWGMGLEQGKTQLDIERFELDKRRFAAEGSRFEAQSARTYAGQVVQALLLLNGAAALAILTFIGTFSKDANFKGSLAYLSDPLSSFSYGAAFAVLTAIFAYLSQATWADKKEIWGDTLRIFAVAFALGSLLLFVGGVSHAEAAFGALSQGVAFVSKAP